jgi:HEAT repeat protein
MSNFLGHRALIDTLIKTLHDDPSYAVQAAAARQLGRSGDEDAFNALRSEAQSSLQEIVAMGVLDGLAASKNSQAAQILLGYAQPGTPERIREHALSDLPQLKGELQRSNARRRIQRLM